MKYLERRLTLLAIVAISISSMLGSGIFVLPGVGFSVTGPSLWLAYLVSAICVLPAAFSKAELATAMPKSGGTYVYIERTFGPLAGTVAGIGLWLSLLLKSTFALVGTGAYLSVVAHVDIRITAAVLLFIIIGINILGVGKVSTLLMLVVSVSLVTLAGVGIGGIANLDATLLEPHFPNGFNSIFTAAALVFVSFAGITKIAAIAEEVKDPNRNIPLGILISLIVVTLIYCGITFSMAGNVSTFNYPIDLKPFHTFANTLGGKWLGYLAAVVAIATMVSMANAGVLATSRFPFAMSRDHLLPSLLGRLSARFLTPVNSIIMTGFIMAAAISFLNVEKIAKLASAFMIIMFIVECFTVIVLRELRVRWYKPGYLSPMYPFIQIFGIISGVFLLLMIGSIALIAIISIAVPGVLLFAFYSRHRTERKGVIGFRGKRPDLIQMESAEIEKAELGFLNEIEGEAQTVVALFGQERSPEMVVELGAALADKGKLEVAYITEIPEQTALQDINEASPKSHSLARRVKTMSEKTNSTIEFEQFYCHDLYKTVYNIGQRMHCIWLVKEWGGKTQGAFTMNNHMAWLENNLPCNLATFRDSGVRYIKKVLVCVKGDKQDSFVLDTAVHLAHQDDAEVSVVSIIPKQSSPSQQKDATARLKALTQKYTSTVQIIVKCEEDFRKTLIDFSSQFDLLVLKDKRHHSGTSKWFGGDLDYITANAACSVVRLLARKDLEKSS